MSTRKAPVKKPGTGKGTSKKTGGGGGGGGGGGYSPKKTDDRQLLKALKALLNGGFAKARNQHLANIDKMYATEDADLLKGYQDRANQLGLARTDNDKSEADASFANLANRARETQDILAQTAEQGAGESDTAKAQLMALQNWDANQGEVNRSYFDTVRSVNNAVNDLNVDTRTARINLATQMLGDKQQAWANFQNQMVETATQAANLTANPYSNAYKKGSGYYKDVVKNASKVWENPGVDKAITDWEGAAQPQEGKLNNTMVKNVATVQQPKKPTGASTGALKAWED